MRVMVTGGSGFIGQHVMQILSARGHDALCYDLKPPIVASPTTGWVHGDITDYSKLSAALREFQPQAVIHLAARADIFAQEWDAFRSIHLGTAVLLKAIESCPSIKKLVNVSTQLVISPGYEPRSLLDYRPYTLYGEAKAYAESLLLQWRSPVHWFTVRPANVWGPHHPSFASEIWKYIAKRYYLHPQTREPVVRSYGYVANTAEQIIALMLADDRHTYRQVYYAADAVIDSAVWVDAFSKELTGRPARRIPAPALRLMGRVGDILSLTGARMPIDSGRAMRMTQSYAVPLTATHALTGDPSITLEAGVDITTAWLRQHWASN